MVIKFMATLPGHMEQQESILPVPIHALRRDPLAIVLILLVVTTLVLRAFYSLAGPLEFDETFTMVIASQRTLGGFAEWVLHELGGPVYYTIAFAWEKIVGTNPMLMRLPSFAAALATPLVIVRSKVVDRRTLLIWAALMAISPYAIMNGALARSYALLVLVSTFQAIAFLRLLRDPRPALAVKWVGLSALAILTHYHASLISLAQGLLFLAYRPRAALRCWPAALLLIPVLAWMGAQASFVLAYAKPGGNWYQLLAPADILPAASKALGMGGLSILVAGEGLYAFVAQAVRHQRWLSRHDSTEVGVAEVVAAPDWPLALTVLSGFVAAISVATIGVLTPSFSLRYLLPYAPAMMLGISKSLESIGRRHAFIRREIAVAAVGLVMTLAAVAAVTFRLPPQQRFSVEPASDWIMEQGDTKALLFFWDNPTSNLDGSWHHLGEFARYAFERKGRPVNVLVPQHMPTDADPNAVLPKIAQRHGAGFLWVYDKYVPGTLGIRHPFTKAPAGWKCRRFVGGTASIVGCVPQTPPT